MSSAAFGPPPFPMLGLISIDTDSIGRQRSPSFDLLRTSPARPFACEPGAISCVRAQRDLLHTTLWPMSVHVFFRRLCAFVALVPHYRRTERLLRGCSGGVALLPFRQRHLGQYHFWWRVVEGLAWDRTPAPPLGALLARIKGPGPGVLSTGSPLSRGVSRCRSARPRYLHDSCFIRGGGRFVLHLSAVGHELA